MPFQRLVPTRLHPSHAWGIPNTWHDAGMLFSTPKHLVLPNHPGRGAGTGASLCSSGREPEPRSSLRQSHNGHIRELKITRLSCNRLALAPAALAAWGLGAGSQPLPAARKGGEMEPVGAARPGAGSGLP